MDDGADGSQERRAFFFDVAVAFVDPQRHEDDDCSGDNTVDDGEALVSHGRISTRCIPDVTSQDVAGQQWGKAEGEDHGDQLESLSQRIGEGASLFLREQFRQQRPVGRVDHGIGRFGQDGERGEPGDQRCCLRRDDGVRHPEQCDHADQQHQCADDEVGTAPAPTGARAVGEIAEDRVIDGVNNPVDRVDGGVDGSIHTEDRHVEIQHRPFDDIDRNRCAKHADGETPRRRLSTLR